jgi:hypothetical protein
MAPEKVNLKGQQNRAPGANPEGLPAGRLSKLFVVNKIQSQFVVSNGGCSRIRTCQNLISTAFNTFKIFCFEFKAIP